jgi:alkylated DNA repair dioxygenase AlkB
MDLFSTFEQNNKPSQPTIKGLTYLENFITKDHQRQLITIIDEQTWLDDLKRRVQHYGYKYDYKARRIDTNMYLGELPLWTKPLIQKFLSDNLFDVEPDQLIINEYLPGQGIANHIDCEPCFDDTVISISLNSFCVMDFCNQMTKQKIPFLLEPCSAVVLKGESRYDWTHGIAARKSDSYNNQTYLRKRRISLTFRRTIK